MADAACRLLNTPSGYDAELGGFFLSPTVGSRPFPGMKTTPASSRVARIFIKVPASESAPFSIRVMVLALTLAFLARSRTLQPSAARAIRSCAAVIMQTNSHPIVDMYRSVHTMHQPSALAS